MKKYLSYINIYFSALVIAWMLPPIFSNLAVPLPYEYYIALRYIVFIAMIFSIIKKLLFIDNLIKDIKEEKHDIYFFLFDIVFRWVIPLLLYPCLIYLFNPIEPVHLNKYIWTGIDFVTTALMVLKIASNYAYLEDESRSTSRYSQTKG